MTPPQSAITEMWLWDNSVSPEDDGRGTGYGPANPDELVQFALAHNLKTVHVTTAWASDEGPVAVWTTDTVTALRAAGIKTGLLGGDWPWLDDPNLAATWIAAGTNGRTVDHVQLDVEPWARPLWISDRELAAHQWLTLLDTARTALPAGVKLGADVPHWLTSVPSPTGTGTLFDDALERLDEVGIVTFADHADGSDGILALSADAVAAAQAAGIPYTIGLETDTPAVAGGAQFTFYDEGAAELESQARTVADALSDHSHFRGITVEHYRAWRTLLTAPDPS